MQITRDLVCGMEVDPVDDAFQSNYGDNTYYFCSAECKSRFDALPTIYIQNNAEALQAGRD
jgi:Cu+-exporting ATPase